MLYCSRHGFTKRVLEALNELHGQGYHLVDIDEVKQLNLDEVEEILIGGSLYYGKLSKGMIYFIEDNIRILLDKKVVLFLIGLKVDRLQHAFELNFPKCFLDIFPRFYLGGSYDESRVRGFEVFQLKRIKKKYRYSARGEVINLEQIEYYLHR